MSQTSNYLAFDLGAESGRVVVGRFDGEKLELTTVSRFPNEPVRVFDSLYWDVLHLFREIKRGLTLYRSEFGPALDGVGLDTWGVDWALLDAQGELVWSRLRDLGFFCVDLYRRRTAKWRRQNEAVVVTGAALPPLAGYRVALLTRPCLARICRKNSLMVT